MTPRPYTSGSTGKPKGVQIEHRSLVAFASSFRQECGLNTGDRVLQFASLAFDASVEEIFPFLISGGTIVLPREMALESPDRFRLKVLVQKVRLSMSKGSSNRNVVGRASRIGSRVCEISAFPVNCTLGDKAWLEDITFAVAKRPNCSFLTRLVRIRVLGFLGQEMCVAIALMAFWNIWEEQITR